MSEFGGLRKHEITSMHLYLRRRNVAAHVAEELKTVTYATPSIEKTQKEIQNKPALRLACGRNVCFPLPRSDVLLMGGNCSNRTRPVRWAGCLPYCSFRRQVSLYFLGYLSSPFSQETGGRRYNFFFNFVKMCTDLCIAWTRQAGRKGRPGEFRRC